MIKRTVTEDGNVGKTGKNALRKAFTTVDDEGNETEQSKPIQEEVQEEEEDQKEEQKEDAKGKESSEEEEV